MSILSSVIRSARILTKSDTLYEAYHELTKEDKRKVKGEKRDSTIPDTPDTKSGSGAPQITATPVQDSQSNAPQTQNLSGDKGSVSEGSGIPNNRKALHVLNKIHNAMVHLGVTVNKIAADTATLVKNSNDAIENANEASANAAARINEHEFSGETRTEKVKEKDENHDDDNENPGSLLKKFTEGFVKNTVTKELITLIAGALLPLLSEVIVPMLIGAGVTWVAVKAVEAVKDKITEAYEPKDMRPPGEEEHPQKKTKGPSKKFSQDVENSISVAAQENGVDVGYMRTVAKIESGGNPNAKNPKSSAKGLYQFIEKTAEGYNIKGKEFDMNANARAMAQFTRDNKKQLEKAGIEATPDMLYLAHQQGAGGATSLVKKVAAGKGWEDLSEGQKKAILDNGGRTGMSPSEFISMWKNKYEKLSEESENEEKSKIEPEGTIHKNGVGIIPEKKPSDEQLTAAKQEETKTQTNIPPKEEPTATKLKSESDGIIHKNGVGIIPEKKPSNEYKGITEGEKYDQNKDEYLNVEPINKNLENTATLEIPEKTSSGNIITDVQNTPTQIQKTPDETQDTLKKIVDQSSKPQQPIIIQQPQQPTQTQEKPKTAPMLNVRNNDDPIWMWMQQDNIKIV